MATAPSSRPGIEWRSQWTTPQMFWLVFQAMALLGVAAWQFLANPELTMRFWNDPLGVKMAAAALLLLVVNFAALLGGCFVLNRLTAWSLREQPLVGKALIGLLFGGCFVLFYLPAFFVFLIGPATVAIRASLLAP